jgi:hypothetical protein
VTARRRLAVVLAALLAALLAGAAVSTSVAHAAQTTTNPWPWPMICTQAAFTGYGVDEQDGVLTVSLSGWIQPCIGVTDPGARRTFTVYRPGSVAVSASAAPLLDAETGTYAFSMSGALSGAVDAVCVIDGVYANGKYAIPSLRACVGVDEGPTGPVVAPIPTTDARVLGSLPYPWVYPDDPHCGTCV